MGQGFFGFIHDGVAYVLGDHSVSGAAPEAWAAAVAAAAQHHGADRVVAEANNGGAMVKSVLQAADVGLPVTLVHARSGKSARAELVALLFTTAGRSSRARSLSSRTNCAGWRWAGPMPDRDDLPTAPTRWWGR